MANAILGRNERVMLILVDGVITVVDLNTGEILDELPGIWVVVKILQHFGVI